MKMSSLGLLLCLALVHVTSGQAAESAAGAADTSQSNSGERTERVRFNRDIRPILSDKCFFCHGPDSASRQADLRLDRPADATEYAIVPGDPESSVFIARITHDDPLMRMPPQESGKALDDAEIALLRRWVQQGAEYDEHWAYVPPQRHPVPEVEHATWSHHWIDRFLYARLQAEGMLPSERADRVTLIRRLSFDLTGLPPSPDEVHNFVNDRSPHAYEQIVDRLLASEHFGERMTLYWLDLVRYADTVGYHGDQDHNISPYRDWVIDAFNDNLPFDQFTWSQIAGDLLPDSDVDDLIASGYNRLLQTSHEGGVQPKEYLAIYAADRVRNVSQVWLAGTLGCAQCHDHKYDPYTAKDFYSMAAFFADIDEADHFKVGTNALPTARPPEIKVWSRRERARLDMLKRQLATLEEASRDPECNEDIQGSLEAVRDAIHSVEDAGRLTMITQSIVPRTTRILPRGNWLDESGPIVQPAVPEFLGTIDTGGSRATRLDLARWLTDPEQGAGKLTARVMANRLWYLLFGVGLAASLDDFGGQGEPPVHPELLDTLAMEFLESGWNVKALMKQMVMTEAYRQTSQATDRQRALDPYNQLYSHQARYRLPAEMVRDNALAISGLLVRDIGGPSVKPYQPAGYYRHLNFPQRKYHHDTDRRQWRRGLYVHWQRQFLHPMLKSMDAPSREECTAQRPRSNTPLAALTLMNDPTFVEAARVFAERVLQEGGDSDAQRLQHAFRLALSRLPDDTESKTLIAFLQRNRQHYAADHDAADSLAGIGLAPRNPSLNSVELAAWTAVARAILNLSETMTRY